MENNPKEPQRILLTPGDAPQFMHEAIIDDINKTGDHILLSIDNFPESRLLIDLGLQKALDEAACICEENNLPPALMGTLACSFYAAAMKRIQAVMLDMGEASTSMGVQAFMYAIPNEDAEETPENPN